MISQMQIAKSWGRCKLQDLVQVHLVIAKLCLGCWLCFECMNFFLGPISGWPRISGRESIWGAILLSVCLGYACIYQAEW